jgi:hypothetical protein
MTDCTAFNKLVAADPGQRSSSGDRNINCLLTTCLALGLLGGLAATTGVATLASLLLANCHL